MTNPEGTAEEFRDISVKELRDRLLSTDYLALWLGRILFQATCLVTGIAILYIIGRAENGQSLRSFVARQDHIDQIDQIMQQSLFSF